MMRQYGKQDGKNRYEVYMALLGCGELRIARKIARFIDGEIDEIDEITAVQGIQGMFVLRRPVIKAICILLTCILLLRFYIAWKKMEVASFGALLRSENQAKPRADVYIMNTYLITDDTIRMTIITKCDYYPKLTISIGQHISALLELEQAEPCKRRWDALRRCTYAGHYGSTTLPKEALDEVVRGKATMFISYFNESHSRKDLRLIDSRASSIRKPLYRLAVCVAPIAQFSGWTLLARFFEMWIAHGATKFYLMVQSITPEVDAMLRIYENDPKINVERVPWGLLPSSKSTSDDENPNNQLFRSELFFSLNDCTLRARGTVEYLALFDLDEIIMLRNNLTLLQTLDSLVIDDPNIAAFMFRSSYGILNDDTRFVTHPSQINFDSLRNVSLENWIHVAGSLSKLIVRPERVKIAGLHTFNVMEDRKYKGFTIDPATGQIFHLRLVEMPLKDGHVYESNTELTKYIPQWSQFYQERMASERMRIEKRKWFMSGISFAQKEWPNRGHEATEQLERCFLKYLSLNETTCPAHLKCTPNITAVGMDEWVYSEQTAVVI